MQISYKECEFANFGGECGIKKSRYCIYFGGKCEIKKYIKYILYFITSKICKNFTCYIPWNQTFGPIQLKVPFCENNISGSYICKTIAKVLILISGVGIAPVGCRK